MSVHQELEIAGGPPDVGDHSTPRELRHSAVTGKSFTIIYCVLTGAISQQRLRRSIERLCHALKLNCQRAQAMKAPWPPDRLVNAG